MQAVTTLSSSAPMDRSEAPVGQLTGWMLAVASDRDRQAFEGLFGYFAPRIKSYMLRLGTDPASAEDLAQETMVQIWRKAEQFDPAKAAPSAWVFRVARNLRVDRLRKYRFHEVELDGQEDQVELDPRDGQPEGDRLDAARLRDLVQSLPPDQLEVVKLAFFEGLSHSEIGGQLSLPLGTVKSRLRLAFGKLRAAMGEQT